jgi:hypothetical protein
VSLATGRSVRCWTVASERWTAASNAVIGASSARICSCASTGVRAQISCSNGGLSPIGPEWYRRSALPGKHFLLHPRERL